MLQANKRALIFSTGKPLEIATRIERREIIEVKVKRKSLPEGFQMAVHDTLLGGLLLYLQIRDWAFKKMKTHQIGSPSFDLEIQQYLYISNTLAASDLVGETFYGKSFRNPAYETAYDLNLIATFDAAIGSTSLVRGREAYAYVRELRNSVVHRGLGSATAGHANDHFVFALCPTSVNDSAGRNAYRSPWKYMVELADTCNLVFNPVIYAELEKHGIFDPGKLKTAPIGEVMAVIDNSDAMPDWAKGMAHQALAKLDYSKLAMEIQTTRLRELKTHLGIN